MKKRMLILTASFLSTALMTGAIQTGTANAAPAIKPNTQIPQIVKVDAVQKVGVRKQRLKRFVHRNYRHWRWCKNHPRRCRGGYRLRGADYGYAPRKCHRHFYKVPGMHFHARVLCGHRHFRAYRSWGWAY